MTAEALSIWYGTVSMVSWGSGDFLTKRIVGSVGLCRLLFYSQLVGLMPLSLLAIGFSPPPPTSSRTIMLIFAAGVFYALSISCLYKGLALGKASVVAPLASAWALPAIIFSFVFLGETLDLYQLSCVAIVVVGIVMISARMDSTVSLDLSVIYTLASVLFAGSNAIILKFISMDIGEIGTMVFGRGVEALILLIVIPLTGNPLRIVSPKRTSMIGVTAVGLTEFMGYLAFILGVTLGIVSIVTPIASASPAITVLLSQYFLRERLMSYQKIAVMLVVLGIVLLSVSST